MSKEIFSYAIKTNEELGTLNIFEDHLVIKTNSVEESINFSSIKSLNRDGINAKIINIETINKDLQVILVDDKLSKFNEAFNYINERIPKEVKNSNKITFENQTEKKQVLLNINVRVTENKNLLTSLAQQTNLKQNLNYTEKINITELSNFIVYSDSISIDNPVYSQTLPLSMIVNISLKENNSIIEQIQQSDVKHTVEILLSNNSNIVLEFNELETNYAFQVYNTILPRLQHQNISAEQVNYNQQQNQYQNNNQQFQNNNINYPNNYQPRVNQKNVIVAIILHILLCGLGYVYIGKLDKFIIALVVIFICFLTAIFIIPLILGIVLWFYFLFDTIKLVEKYNQGEII
ncbi:MAG: hypothetical protein IJH55_07045 [Romboutsia sp.]|nr:hypothetical protein [Methanosphaera sp.]MBQ6631849.1 hypothetical protein [Romboutsia sp.]